jgi:hypothetical protein
MRCSQENILNVTTSILVLDRTASPPCHASDLRGSMRPRRSRSIPRMRPTPTLTQEFRPTIARQTTFPLLPQRRVFTQTQAHHRRNAKLKKRKRMGSGDPSGLQNRRELASLALVSSTLTRFRQSALSSRAFECVPFAMRSEFSARRSDVAKRPQLWVNLNRLCRYVYPWPGVAHRSDLVRVLIRA